MNDLKQPPQDEPSAGAASLTETRASVFKVTDALSLYQKQVDLTHKLWSYLHVVAIAVLAYSWNNRMNGRLILLVIVGYGLFASINAFLVITSQREAYTTSKLLKKHWRPPAVPGEWAEIAQSFSSWSPVVVGGMHLLIDVSVVLVISQIIGRE